MMNITGESTHTQPIPVYDQAAAPEQAPALDISQVTVIMPLAGRAVRAREVTQDKIPKHLIRLNNGDTVLDTISRQLQTVGFRRFVFCVGFLKEQLIDHIEQGEWITAPDTEYAFDETDRLLGPDGTVLHAIGALSLEGQGMLIPGDVMLPWKRLATMNQRHAETGADITFGVTSYTTERTAEIGKIVVDEATDRLLRIYGREEAVPEAGPGTRNLTSAPSHVISIGRFVDLCGAYRNRFPERSVLPLSLRDEILPWVQDDPEFDIRAYDLRGEILDLGTTSNIYYGQQNWRQYACDDSRDQPPSD